MKITILLVLCICVFVKAAPSMDADTLTKYFYEKEEQIEEKCLDLIEPTDDEIEALGEGKLPTTRAGKCFLACMLSEYGVIDSDKKYNKDALFEMIPDNLETQKAFKRLKMLAERCEKPVINIDDECELAMKLTLCFTQHASEFGLKFDPIMSQAEEYYT